MKSKAGVLIFLVLFISSILIAIPVSQNDAIQAGIPYDCEDDLIEIMFSQDSQVRLRDGSLIDFKSDALTGVDQILEQLDWHNWYRICDVDEDILDQWSINGERNTGKPIYNMNNIYRLQIPKGKDIWKISNQLEMLPGIGYAKPVPKPVPPPTPGNFQSQQGYLNPASSTPTGIDAAYAWTQTGGTGTNITVCDLEYSWNYSHADISKGAGSSLNTWTDPGWGNDHGTAVIGELVSDNNGWGTTGICYGAGLKTCGTYYGSPLAWNVAGAINLAIAALNAGDIILLEQQWEYTPAVPGVSPGLGDYIPIEWYGSTSSSNPNQYNNPVYAAIVTAVSNGIHVVQAGGNGNINTGGLTWFGNSGAIIVGAGGGSAGNDLQRLSFSSYGTRFDLQGWGENVFTTGYGTYYNTDGVNYWYTSTFNGTSSASPIVAGALACAEGYYYASYSSMVSPSTMRSHLKTYGTAQVFGTAGIIGPRPNLYAAITNFSPPAATLDFGDAPDSYLTLLNNNGARHLTGSYYLGALIDTEADGIPTINADGDDNNASDDEDGVVFTDGLTPGGTTNIVVTASQPGYLQCWIDYDGNGMFDIPANEVIINQPLIAGSNNLSFTTPVGATIGSTYARFRFSSYNGLIFYGYCDNGEVEDYQVDIEDEEPEELDFGDAPDPLYPTLLANNGARHILDGVTYLGVQVDSEPDGWQDPNALGDDLLDGNDDEDGIIFNQIMTGSPAQVNVTTSTSGYLSGWMDFDGNGSWDVSEQIFYDVYIHFAGTVCLNYYVPVTATTGLTFARFRFDTIGGLGVTGLASDGEVEDYQVEIIEDPDLKWSQLPCEELPGLHCHDYIDSSNDITIADDWLCNGGLVTDIHWWGNYEAVNSGISHFHLSIHTNDPANCLPVDPEVWGIDVPLSQVTETATGMFSSDGNMIYSYDYVLSDPFPQTEGEYYWLDISAHSVDPTSYVVWNWQESSRSVAPILCPASDRTPPTTWLWIDWLTPVPIRYSDMAFEITSCPPSIPLNFTISKVGINMTLQWDPDPCSIYYNVYSSTDPYAAFPGGWTLETVPHISTTTWNDPISTVGSKKFYRVTAEN